MSSAYYSRYVDDSTNNKASALFSVYKLWLQTLPQLRQPVFINILVYVLILTCSLHRWPVLKYL